MIFSSVLRLLSLMAASLLGLIFGVCNIIITACYKQLELNLTFMSNCNEDPMVAYYRFLPLWTELAQITTLIQRRFNTILMIQISFAFISCSLKSYWLIHEFFPREAAFIIFYLWSIVIAVDDILLVWIICKVVGDVQQSVRT